MNVVADSLTQTFRLLELLCACAELALVLVAVAARVGHHLCPLLLANLVQLEVLRHVRVEAEVRLRREQVLQGLVNT